MQETGQLPYNYDLILQSGLDGPILDVYVSTARRELKTIRSRIDAHGVKFGGTAGQI